MHRSPLSPHALTFVELRKGQSVIRYHVTYGEVDEHEVISLPRLVQKMHNVQPSMYVTLRNKTTNSVIDHHVGDLGLARYSDGEWNTTNFTCDVDKRDLLPPPRGESLDRISTSPFSHCRE